MEIITLIMTMGNYFDFDNSGYYWYMHELQMHGEHPASTVGNVSNKILTSVELRWKDFWTNQDN